MPTGYTAKLMSEGQTFKEFILGCARAMGACITMREDGPEVEIPKQFVPSEYHTEALASAKKKLAKLKGMNLHEKITFGTKVKETRLTEYRRYDANNKEENQRLCDMEKLVLRWCPPTSDHVGFKTFMLEQINISKNSTDYYPDKIKKLAKKSPLRFWEDAVEHEEWNITNSTKELAEERERVNGRNDWINALRESIK